MARPGSGVLVSMGAGHGYSSQSMARVVVWEWLNEHSHWRPYSATVCHHIENILKGDARGTVILGQVDPQLAPYVIDLQSMHQFRQDTGMMRPVQRNFYDPSSAPGKGIVWEWENDCGSWTAYDMELCVSIQNAYEKQHPWLDLTSLGFSYLVNFDGMSQTNRQSQRKRRIRRRMDLAYPLIAGSIPKSQSWPVGTNLGTPCTCQQCLLVHSTRVASNAILALQQRRRLYGTEGGANQNTATVRQSNTFAGTSLCSPTTTVARGHHNNMSTGGGGGGKVEMRGVNFPRIPALVTLPAKHALTINGQNNLNRPGTQRITVTASRGTIPPGVPALPVKNLTGCGPLHPALAGMTGILMCAAGLPVCLTRAPKPVLLPPPVSKSDLKPVPGINGICRKTKKKHLRKGKTPEDVVRRYTEKIRWAPDEDCTICMERLATASGYDGLLTYKGIKPEQIGKLGKCGHIYHLLCLIAMYSNGNKDGSLQCPTCKAIYGEKTGTQPPGKMEYHVIPHCLPGYTDTKTIRIVYDIPAGIQTTEHPNPGKKFSARGFPRHCYLPDNEKGRKVLKLLIAAWDRRLIFTIGTSSTTGETDTVVWNEIHHKTEFGSNLTGHGYPDPNYLDNATRELAAQGVAEDNLKD
ncbi:E3 ubiquitin-protein ligase DTX1-like [Xyrauchen texanus]|uniref:E3 ubiquitin-protein ligase DTX1-like n=1 Tax=Xyrauchen texanus TaxID=154827 RepID=UPI00224234FF|nr:E3 ubiquitin-protein ligase DTX1-like [Xyrauchen texanus]XP_051965116.1 E3 ubiquitin-protein ligase DTX1-like [Xyrauchen texanus]XP_051965117.1 E3 ubiquitin-protein ligase DTX1-like [Xyrauchen texanus]